MSTAEPQALLVRTASAAGISTSGASLRVRDVLAVLHEAGFTTRCCTPAELVAEPPAPVTLGVCVSYATVSVAGALRRRSTALWVDAVDSWLSVNLSGLRAGRPSYLARAGRDAFHLARMPTADLVTYIAATDLQHDHGTIRGRTHLVLPAGVGAPPVAPADQHGRRFVLAGDWSYPPNRDGLAWFRSKCLPLMERHLAGETWTVDLYGRGASGAERLRVHGYIEDERELYRHGDVHLAPVLYGGGVKRKVVSPLLSGLPVVATTVAAQGLRAGPNLDVCATPAQFAAAAARRWLLREAPAPAQDWMLADDTSAVQHFLAAARAGA